MKASSARLTMTLAASGADDFYTHVKPHRRASGDVATLSTRGFVCSLLILASERRDKEDKDTAQAMLTARLQKACG